MADRASDVPAFDSTPCPFADSDLAFTLEQVEFSGLTAVPSADLDPAWIDFRGRTLKVAELCAIRDRTVSLLLDAGYLARVEIPPQEITSGRVQMQVIEARIGTIEVTGDAGPALLKIRQYVKKLEGLTPFRMDTVQRQILLAADVPGIRLATNIHPSSGAAGAVDLTVQVEHDPFGTVAGMQNFGSAAAGPWTVFARADLNSLTGLGERTSLIVSSTADFREQRVLQLLEEIRLGREGLLGRGSLTFADGKPGGALQNLGLTSKSFVAQTELAYPLIRRRRENLWVAAGAEIVDQSTDVFGGASRFIDDKLRVGFLRIDGDLRDRSQDWLDAEASFTLELRRGIGVLGGSERGEPLLSRLAADPRTWVVRGRGRTEFVLPRGFSAATGVMGQWANEPLLAYEEFSVGNYTIGRGYDPGLVTGDRALAGSLEFRYGLPTLAKVGARLFAFYDAAWVDNLDPGVGSGQHTVSSVGGGARLDLGMIGLELAYARPLDATIAGGARPHDRLLFNLITRLR